MKWHSRLPLKFLCTYGDRSDTTESHLGFNFYEFLCGTNTNLELSNSSPLIGAEVYDAEIYGAMAVLEAITTNFSDHNILTLYSFLDSVEAAQTLQIGKTTSSYWRDRRFPRVAEGSILPVYAKWIPGHENIPINKVADQLAWETLD